MPHHTGLATFFSIAGDGTTSLRLCSAATLLHATQCPTNKPSDAITRLRSRHMPKSRRTAPVTQSAHTNDTTQLPVCAHALLRSGCNICIMKNRPGAPWAGSKFRQGFGVSRSGVPESRQQISTKSSRRPEGKWSNQPRMGSHLSLQRKIIRVQASGAVWKSGFLAWRSRIQG